MNCPLCNRKGCEMSDHHLVPKGRGGAKQEQVLICNDCHRTIHAFFDNKVLEQSLNSVEALQANAKFDAHLHWLKKRPVGTRFRTKTANAKRRRRRY